MEEEMILRIESALMANLERYLWFGRSSQFRFSEGGRDFFTGVKKAN
jgi:hypothetical protein